MEPALVLEAVVVMEAVVWCGVMLCDVWCGVVCVVPSDTRLG